MSFLTLNVTFFSAAVALILSPLFFWLSRRLTLVDVPGREPHKQHTTPMPIAGGLVLLGTLILIGLGFRIFNLPEVKSLLIPALIIFLFGLWDDLRGISPLWKFIGQLLAAAALIVSGVQVLLFAQPWLNYAVTMLWVVGITNAYNFVDSMDGLVVGLGGLAAAFFMLVTFDSGQQGLSVFSAAVLGACIGLFYFNAPPAKYFMGDSGSQFLGFLMAALGIAYNPVGFEPYASWYVPILLMAVPIFDTTLIVFSRLRRGHPVFIGAHDHTYHRLVALGISPNRAVLTMQIAALLLGTLAFIALTLPPLIANIIFGAILLLGVIVILFLDSPRIQA
ncbi:MAG: glycosyltransferase family 4 protein [Anaerolineales bacterium]|jgi:UDP-GlcNAc:undecaprenyl-phosphate GlcNAc-1-phosphate transferase